MATFNGNDLVLKYAITEAGTKEVFAHATSCTISFSNSLIDVTTKDSNSFEEMISGRKSFTLSSDGLMDYSSTTDAHNFEAVADVAIAGTKIFFTYGVGSDTYEGEAFMESFDANGESDGAATYSVSLKGTGALTKTA